MTTRTSTDRFDEELRALPKQCPSCGLSCCEDFKSQRLDSIWDAEIREVRRQWKVKYGEELPGEKLESLSTTQGLGAVVNLRTTREAFPESIAWRWLRRTFAWLAPARSERRTS